MRKLLTLGFLLLVGCGVSDSTANETLTAEGLHNPTYHGPGWPWSCDEHDHFSERFTAYRTVLSHDGHPSETEVEGVICCGYITCVVRY